MQNLEETAPEQTEIRASPQTVGSELNLPEPLAQLHSGPVFVVGQARSGTTWVFDILTAHPQVAGAFETGIFTSDRGLGVLLRRNRLPSGLVLETISQLWSRDELLLEVREMAARKLAQLLKPEHRVLVEKSPAHIRKMELIDEVFPEARFIHVLRDGRDVAVSVRAAYRGWAPQWRSTIGRSTWHMASSWRSAVSKARAFGALHPDRFMEIKYEELKADPREGYRRLFAFCGLPYDESLLDTVFQKTDFDTNYQGKEDAFRRKGQVGEGRTRLTRWERWLFDLAAGDALAEAGYGEVSGQMRALHVSRRAIGKLLKGLRRST